MSLKVSNLSKYFEVPDGTKPVLEGLDLNVACGETFALMGANGSGKTTLLKIISTLILPTSGEVRASGVDVVREPQRAKKLIGLVTDAEGSFYQMLSAEDNIKFFARLYGFDTGKLASRMAHMFRELGIEEYRNIKFSHLSSGIRHKLAFARAMLAEPEVLLVDEISRSLDETSTEKISAYLKRTVKETSCVCLAVTHDMSWAQQYADRTGTLINGKIDIA